MSPSEMRRHLVALQCSVPDIVEECVAVRKDEMMELVMREHETEGLEWVEIVSR